MMKKLLPFLTGVLLTLFVIGVPATAFAVSGTFTIEASPINVLVNGEVFRPKDARGNDALVFVYNGTTYAPLRALAEAYGLEVGYDGSKNLAIVNNPAKQTAAQSGNFKAAWTVKEKPVTNYGTEKIFTATYNGDLSKDDFKTWWKSFGEAERKNAVEELAAEAQAENPGYTVTMYFSYGQYSLGTAFAFGEYESSNFIGADVWIK